MDTYSDNGTHSKVIQMWSRDDSKQSDDPLEDLINEFGTETEDDQTFAWEEELFNHSEEDLDLDLMVEESRDYFYDQLKETKGQDLESVSELVHKAKYLTHKLKYYNTYLLNKE